MVVALFGSLQLVILLFKIVLLMLQVSLEKLDKMVSSVQAVVLVEVFKLLQRILSVTVYLI
jgi:hypothetical protein